MIAKIKKGRGFKGVVGYILDPKKGAELIAALDVRCNSRGNIVKSFVTQAEMNPRLSKPVCHVSLSFSPQDKDKLTNETMTRIACDYMARMGFVNTQFIIARHFDKDHPHIHIVFNRVGNDGKTISDQNDHIRSEKICKALTQKYGLHFAQGKDQVNEHRLEEPDKTKYEIYNALKATVPRCKSWPELVAAIKRHGIGVELIRNGDTDKIQGVKFSKNGYHFNGSKIDRQFSYSKIDAQLEQNGLAREVRNASVSPTPTASPMPSQVPAPTHQPGGSGQGAVGNAVADAISFGVDVASGVGGMFDFAPHGTYDENEIEARKAALKRKKKNPNQNQGHKM